MTIGLDLSVIQTPHRMRGIGSTAINFINNIPASAKLKHKFVIYLYEEKQTEALQILNLDGLNYEVRTMTKLERSQVNLPGKLRRVNSLINGIRGYVSTKQGDRRKSDRSDLNVYLQFDQMQPFAKLFGVKKAVILYDLIPYVMEADYLWSYRTARQQGDSRKSSLRKAMLRKQYVAQLKAVCASADKMIAISNHTKQDFVKYLGIPEQKIQVVHLGIEPKQLNSKKDPQIEQYIENSWGYFPKEIDLKKKPFLLFVGGADPRRKLIDLVAAFNNLRARGKDITLVFAGDTMKGARTIPVLPVQKYINSSSYLDDIAFLGFVTDEQREWLYENALAMVYPSVYEGFGLPLLEAMQYGTPVVTYKNSSIHEVAGDAALYTEDALSIEKTIEELLGNPNLRKQYSLAGQEQASKFDWQKTSANIISQLEE